MDGVANLPAADRAFLFEETAVRRNLANPEIVEKDSWVSWTLHRLFGNSALPRLLFKGGTSLSKCFSLIHRFSEDIDLGIAREDIGLVGELDPMAQPSRKRAERAREAMTERVQEYVAKTLFPMLEADFRATLVGEFILHSPDPNSAEPTLRFEYPRALDASRYGSGDYVRPVVRLELGARSDHDPVRAVEVRPYAAEEFESEFKQPNCKVVAQAPERTLLEKALILHANIDRGFKEQSSRHAYDLAMMRRNEPTMSYVTRDLFKRVAHHKFMFGENTSVRDAPRDGIRLVPEGDALRSLEADYTKMQEMFYTSPTPPTLEQVLEDLGALQGILNRL